MIDSIYPTNNARISGMLSEKRNALCRDHNGILKKLKAEQYSLMSILSNPIKGRSQFYDSLHYDEYRHLRTFVTHANRIIGIEAM